MRMFSLPLCRKVPRKGMTSRRSLGGRRTISGGSCESQAVCMKYVNDREILGSVSPVRSLHLTLKWDRMVSDCSRFSLNSSFLRRQSKSHDSFQNKFCMVNITGCLDNNITLAVLPICTCTSNDFCVLCPHKCNLVVCCILPFSVWPSEVREPQRCQQAAGNHHHL